MSRRYLMNEFICGNLEQAKANRERIKAGYALKYWLELEQDILNTPLTYKLGKNVPTDDREPTKLPKPLEGFGLKPTGN